MKHKYQAFAEHDDSFLERDELNTLWLQKDFKIKKKKNILYFKLYSCDAYTYWQKEINPK